MTPIFSEITFFDGFFGKKKIVVDDFVSVEIVKDITDIGEMTLKIPKKSGISVMDKVIFLQIFRTEEKAIFKGFVSEIEADEYFLVIKILDFKQILERKLCTTEIKSNSANAVFAQIVRDWNAFSGENLKIENETEITKKIEISPWTSVYSAISDIIGEDAVFAYDIDKNTVFIKKILGKNRTGIYTYSPYHADNQIMEISAKITENYYTVTYDTENKRKRDIEGTDKAKYGVLVSNSDKERMSGNYGIGREFSLVLRDETLSAGDGLTLEIIGKNYTEQKIEQGWSVSSGKIAGDYISYFGEAFVLREKIVIENGFYDKTLEIGTKIRKQKTLTDLLLQAVK